MKKVKRRGFVLAELLVGLAALGGFATAHALSSTFGEPLERLCIGAAPTPNGGERSRMVSEIQRWVCVSVASVDSAEFRFAGSPRDPRAR